MNPPNNTWEYLSCFFGNDPYAKRFHDYYTPEMDPKAMTCAPIIPFPSAPLYFTQPERLYDFLSKSNSEAFSNVLKSVECLFSYISALLSISMGYNKT